MTYKAYWMLIISLVCLAVAAQKMTPAYQDATAVQKEYATKAIDGKTRRDKILSAFVNQIGASYLWYLGTFVPFGFAMHYVYSHVRRWWAKLIFALPTLFIFVLATAFFLVADESAKFISENSRAESFASIIKIKVSMVLVGLFLGRLCFDMLKPFISKENA